MQQFDRSRYKSDGRLIFEDKIDEAGNLRKAPTFQLPDFADSSDAYANNFHTVLSFQNVRNDSDVYFKAFITAFNETYSPNFNSTEVFGRTDPIQQYKNTTRNITLAWKVPAASESEAYENLIKTQSLIQMLYPSYLKVSEIDNALTLSQAPLVRLKVMNLLQKNKNSIITQGGGTDAQIYERYFSVNDPSSGILGVITSCTINHNLEGTDGVFHKQGENPGTSRGTILPKLIDINISFIPLHEQTLGYGSSEDSIAFFPYGVEAGPSASDGRQGTGNNDQQLIGQVQRGQTLSELRKVKEDLEKKRRQAASDQQNADRQAASARRARRRLNRMKRRGSDNDTRRDRLQGTVNEQARFQSEFEAAVPEIQAAESLIGSNSTY